MTRVSFALTLAMLTAFFLTSCSSEPEWTDPETHEKTELLREQYTPLIVGTWHIESIKDKGCFYECLTFHGDGTLSGVRKMQQRELVTIDGEQRYSDWEDGELSGTFTGTWSLLYWSPDGGEKRNCLQLTATYDGEERNYMAYSTSLNFGYADETTLRVQDYLVHNDDGWTNYQRGEAKPSF